MSELFSIIFNVISPIFIVIGIAVFVGRRFNPDRKALSTLLIYIFLPALAFRGMATTQAEISEIGQIAVVVTGVTLGMIVVGLIISRVMGFEQRLESAFVLSIMTMNAANYGIPLNTFAFGEAGGERAILYWLMASILANTLGVFFASRGTGSIKDALMNVVRVPIVYALVIGLVVNFGNIEVPLPIFRAIDILADAAIPGMMVLLGLALAYAEIRGRIGIIMLAAGSRLIIAPMIALPIAIVFGLKGVTFDVAIIESSMPTAVVASAFALQFGSDAEFTASVTLVSTVASIITLSILLLMLGGVAV